MANLGYCVISVYFISLYPSLSLSPCTIRLVDTYFGLFDSEEAGTGSAVL